MYLSSRVSKQERASLRLVLDDIGMRPSVSSLLFSICIESHSLWCHATAGVCAHAHALCFFKRRVSVYRAGGTICDDVTETCTYFVAIADMLLTSKLLRALLHRIPVVTVSAVRMNVGALVFAA